MAPWDRERRRLLAVAILLGIGLGGFFDGIVPDQVLRWRHALGSPAPPESVAGALLWRLGRR